MWSTVIQGASQFNANGGEKLSAFLKLHGETECKRGGLKKDGGREPKEKGRKKGNRCMRRITFGTIGYPVTPRGWGAGEVAGINGGKKCATRKQKTKTIGAGGRGTEVAYDTNTDPLITTLPGFSSWGLTLCGGRERSTGLA